MYPQSVLCKDDAYKNMGISSPTKTGGNPYDFPPHQTMLEAFDPTFLFVRFGEPTADWQYTQSQGEHGQRCRFRCCGTSRGIARTVFDVRYDSDEILEIAIRTHARDVFPTKHEGGVNVLAYIHTECFHVVKVRNIERNHVNQSGNKFRVNRRFW